MIMRGFTLGAALIVLGVTSTSAQGPLRHLQAPVYMGIGEPIILPTETEDTSASHPAPIVTPDPIATISNETEALAVNDTAAPVDTFAPLSSANDTAAPMDTAAPVDTAAPMDTIAPSQATFDTMSVENGAATASDTVAPMDTVAPADTAAPADTFMPAGVDTNSPADSGTSLPMSIASLVPTQATASRAKTLAPDDLTEASLEQNASGAITKSGFSGLLLLSSASCIGLAASLW